MGNNKAQANKARCKETRKKIVFSRVLLIFIGTLLHFFSLYSIHAAPLDPDSPLRGKYVGIGLLRDHPASKSKEFFSKAQPTPYAVYHYIRGDWSMGLRFYLNRFATQEGHWVRNELENTGIPIMTISQSSDYLIRIYYPLYLGLGYSLTYHYPMEKMAFPGKRNPILDAEFGAGVGISFYYQIAPRFIGQTRAERWRGIATTRLQGYHFSFGFSYRV